MVKRTDATGDWQVYHRSLANTEYLVLNTTAAKATGATRWNSTTPTSTVFSLGTDATVNASSGTYVAYIFAHDAAGFGLTGTDNVISCSSFTVSAGGLATVNLGYEPQWILMKPSTTASSGNWIIADTMRGLICDSPGGAPNVQLFANLTNAESGGAPINITSTGFEFNTLNSNWYNQTWIYIAIRRGPMKVPTVGTSVLGLNARSGTGANATVTGGQTDDAVLIKNRGSAVASLFSSRLTSTGYLVTSSDAAEVAAGTTILQANPWDVMDGVKVGTTSTITNASSNTFINYLFKRAPSVFDVCCYTGNGSTQNVSHNLGVVPELIIAKSRSLSGSDWWVYASPLTTPQNKYLRLQSTDGESTATGLWGSSLPTLTTFGLGAFAPNSSGETFVAYLFATCAGVSKVGSYTGNGSSQTINCGFTAGARFVLIKATSTTGDWMVADSARGIVSGNDPYIDLNNTNVEVTGEDWLDTDSTGFVVNEVSGSNANTNGATYIFLAIA
jgi:hypothetical protein